MLKQWLSLSAPCNSDSNIAQSILVKGVPYSLGGRTGNVRNHNIYVHGVKHV